MKYAPRMTVATMKHAQRLASLIDGLRCGLESLTYNYEDAILTLNLPHLHCTDMRGAVDFAIYHFPDVRTILTVSSGRTDTVYRRRGAEWEARDGQEERS